METPDIVTRENAHIVFTRETGDYEIGSEIAWKRLSDELNALEEKFKDVPATADIKLDIKDSELLGICYDDPQVTDVDKIRYDACIAWNKQEIDFLKQQGFETKQLSGGRYARVLHKGKKSETSWFGLYAWIEKQGLEFRDEPSFEKYLNLPEEVEPSDLETEIYVPIQ